jgi:ATP-dependent Clp protease, protease subunit
VIASMSGVRCETAGNVADIWIFGPIEGDDEEFSDSAGVVTPTKVRDALNDATNARTVTIHVDSPGGSPFAAFAILSLLAESGKRVLTMIDGVAASAGSIVAMAGEQVTISQYGGLMINEVMTNLSRARVADLEKQAKVVAQLNDRCVALYVKRTGQPEATIRKMMRDETWFDAKSAVAMGFADKIATRGKMAACIGQLPQFDYKNVPEQFRVNSESAGEHPDAELRARVADALLRSRVQGAFLDNEQRRRQDREAAEAKQKARVEPNERTLSRRQLYVELPNGPDDQRHKNALHESAHAVALCLCGRSPDSAEVADEGKFLDDDGATLGRVLHCHLSREDGIFVAAAGMAVTSMISGSLWGSEADLDSLQTLGAIGAQDRPDSSSGYWEIGETERFRALRHGVERELRPVMPFVKCLADQLYIHGYLDGPTIERAWRRYRAGTSCSRKLLFT